MKAFNNLDSNKIWKAHNLIFPAIAFSALYMFLENLDWGFRGIAGWAYDKGGVEPISLWTIDGKIPIISTFFIPYATSIAMWLLIPVIFFCIYGRKNFSKFIGISTLVFITNLLIGVCIYANTKPIEQYGIDILQNLTSKSYFDDKLISTLKNGSGYSGFPSNHCTCTLLLFFGFVDFAFCNKKIDIKSKRFIAEIILIPLFGIYTLSVCAATFILKIHYFVDFWLSLLICVFWWVICSFFKKVNFVDKIYLKAIINFEVIFGYMSKELVEWKDYMTTCLKSSLPDKIIAYDKKKFITHYVFSDILCLLIFGFACVWWVFWGLIVFNKLLV